MLFGTCLVSSSLAFAATEFVSGDSYIKGDEVIYNGVTYTAKYNTPAGKEPGKTDYWVVATTSGTDWSAGATYAKGTEVTHNGVTYTAVYNTPVGKEPGKTGYWTVVEVVAPTIIDLNKYLAWPAGTYVFTNTERENTFSTITFDENGNETSFVDMSGGEIVDEASIVYNSDGSYTEINNADEPYSNSWQHWYEVIEMRPTMCDDRDPETNEPTGGQSPCPHWVLIMDENGNPIMDIDGNYQFEMEYDVNGDPVLDEFGNHKQVLVYEYEHRYHHPIDVTRTESCSEELTFSPISERSFSQATLGVPTSMAFKEKVTGTRVCETTYSFPNGLPEGVLEESVRAQDLMDGTVVQDVNNISFETETVTPLVKANYQLGEQQLTDCLMMKFTESNDFYNQYDDDVNNVEFNTYCAGIGLVEHRAPASSDNDWKAVIMKRTSFVAAE